MHSPVLMTVGEPGGSAARRGDPVLLADLFFRVRGAAAGKAGTCLPPSQAPRRPGVTFTDVTTISLGGGKGAIAHLVNDTGAAARPGDQADACAFLVPEGAQS